MKVNGHLSQAFLVKRGLRQSAIYDIFAKIFLENLRQNKGMKGIVIGEKELKTFAFAADTTIAL